MWGSIEQMHPLPVERLVAALVGEMILFLEARPALLVLFRSPSNRDPVLLDFLRNRLARILRASALRLTRAEALLRATVSFQIMKAMNELYVESAKNIRTTLVRHYEAALSAYLRQQMRQAAISPQPTKNK